MKRHVFPRQKCIALLIAGLALTEPRTALSALPPINGQAQAPAIQSGGTDETSALELPPARWFGTLSYNLTSMTAEGKSTMQQAVTARANVFSYLWQPWFAQVSGGLALTRTGNSGDEYQSSNSNLVTGDIHLYVLPQSRFPFAAYYEKGESSLSGSAFTGYDYSTQRLGFTQRYIPEQDNAQYSASFNHSTQSSTKYGEDTQDMLNLEMSKQLGNHSLRLSGNASRNTRERSGENATIGSLLLAHDYRPDATLSVQSQASMNQWDYKLAQGSTASRYTQLNSYAFWRPEEWPALTATGGVRLFNTDNLAGSGSTGMNVNAGANYALTNHTRLYGNANVSLMESSGGSQTVATSQMLGASYQPDPIALGNFQYNWYTSGSFTNSTSSANSTSSTNPTAAQGVGQQLGLQLGHGLNHGMSLAGGMLGSNLSQSISSTLDSNDNNLQYLSHSGSLSWNLSQGASMTYLRLSASDYRSQGANSNTFQIINFQASSNHAASRNSSWGGNLTVQATRQNFVWSSIGTTTGTETGTSTETGSFNVGTSAGLNYQHWRAFGIPRLRFVSELRINNSQTKPLLGEPQDMVDKYWRNYFDYTIGRTHFRLSENWSQNNGNNVLLLMFSVERSLGD